ncbi:MAG: starch-binding protein, partial [Muribaculaceae bacterium]|nr:starch-binding protein [Muribaculaceae bacterium]
MKNSLLFCLLTLLGTLIGNATTVYFVRPAGVTGSTEINKYTWNDTTNEKFDGNWPGRAITVTTETIDGKTYIVEEIDDAAQFVIFNWDGGQTANLEIVDNGVYDTSGRIGSIENGHFKEFTVGSLRYYFLNSANWEKIYIHAWSPQPWTEGWPGHQMTETETLPDGKEYYFIEVREDQPLQNIIFNNGTGTQTDNITGASVVPNGIYTAAGYTGMTADQLVAVEGNELYFENDLNWPNIYAYAWSGAGEDVVKYNGEYPGAKITATKEVNGKEVYVVDFEGAENIIFSCFDDSHSHDEAFPWEKTADLTYSAGMTYT